MIKKVYGSLELIVNICVLGKMRIRCLAGRMAMHACQLGPTDTAPPCPGSPLRACVETKGGGENENCCFNK